MYRINKLIGLFGTAVFLLVSCANAEIRTGWVGSNSPGQSSYRFEQFSGDEVYVVDLESNQTIQLSYDIAVEKGLINLKITDPQNEVMWEKEIAEPEFDVAEVMASESGRYHVVIRGDEAKGGFEVEWQVK